MNRPLRVAIVGTGPAGMYALEHLLEERGLEVEVDLFERLPVPWGLVRYGVAPDHPEKKLVADRLFSYFIARHNVRFFGNVEIGKDICHAELAKWYDAVIYAVGANSDIQMGISGEALRGSWAAREFVAWYNGHPDFADLDFDLSSKRAVIVGNGNVALDVARILTMPIEALEKTDIADYALAVLRQSNIEEVVILGRRGHFQGAFNNPELEELEYLDDVDVIVDSEDFPNANDLVLDNADWETRRKVKTLRRLDEHKANNAKKRIVFRFLSSPVELMGDGKVEQLLVIRNRLEHDENGHLKARPTEEESLIDAGLVLRAIGYRGNPFPGLPFNERAGVIGNVNGRIADKGEVLAGAYVTGWIKRGPQGVIGTNKQCADETVACLLEDNSQGKLMAETTLSAEQILTMLAQRQPRYVTEQAWRKIERAERQAGREQQRPRAKICAIDEMLKIAIG